MSGLQHRVVCGVFLFALAAAQARAAAVKDFAVMVNATAQKSPAQIKLTWPADSAASSYTIYRKTVSSTGWGNVATLAGSATSYTDTNVSVGSSYEYQVKKSASGYTGYGYVYSGIEVPLRETHGKVVLIVDNTHAASLASELTRLQQDLTGDGWTVLRHDVSRTATVPSIKSIIRGDYNADPGNVKAVFLFGHVPVPYSGNLNPDGHPEHQGAWPADVYYGEMNGSWTDSNVNNTGADRPENDNRPGDGKFDQSTIPSDVALQVGRVDFNDMPALGKSELELLRQYLNKDHNYRHRIITAQQRALVDDNFGTYNNENFAVNGWRNFSPLAGGANVAASDFISSSTGGSYLWGYGCGAGWYDSVSGIGNTTNFTSNPQVVFTMLFGSYFGDWNSHNNVLRAPLGTSTHGLTCSWTARPYWFYHHMGLGETIGYSTKLSQNNNGSTYVAPTSKGVRGVHIALMGDPTLRLYPVAPPSGLTAITSGGVKLTWSGSPDSVVGYNVYKCPSASGPFTKVNGALITGITYTDTAVPSGAMTYMVKAVDLTVSPSGSFFNSSQGVYKTLGTVSLPEVPANLAAASGDTQIVLNWTAASGASSYSIKRSTTNGGPYSAVGTSTTPAYTNTGLTNDTTYYYVVSAKNSDGESGNSNQAYATPKAGTPTPAELPSPWQHQDIGSVGLAGSATHATNTFNVKASGSDIWSSADSFHFVYQPLNGDGEVVTRVNSIQNTDPWAKAGVMMRETLGNSSMNVMMCVTPTNGVTLQSRASTGGTCTSTYGPKVSAPYWVKLSRSGNTISGYCSTNGTSWTLVGTRNISMNASINVGLAATSHQNAALSSSSLDNTSVTVSTSPAPGGLPSPWVTQDVGAVGIFGGASYASGVFTVKGSGADIWNTADAFRYAYQPLSGDGEIVARVTGVQATDAWAKAGVMIRESLNSNSAFAMAVVTCSNGASFQSRASTGTAAVSTPGAKVAAPYWVKIARSGNTFTASQSADGTTWTVIGSKTISMTSNAYIGLCVTAHNNSLLNTSVFDGVSVK